MKFNSRLEMESEEKLRLRRVINLDMVLLI